LKSKKGSAFYEGVLLVFVLQALVLLFIANEISNSLREIAERQGQVMTVDPNASAIIVADVNQE